MNNPYRRIFKLDESIGSCKSEEELYVIRNKVVRNKKYTPNTKRMICLWILDRVKILREEKGEVK